MGKWFIRLIHRDHTGGEGQKTVIGDSPEDCQNRTERLCERWPRSYVLCQLPQPYVPLTLEARRG